MDKSVSEAFDVVVVPDFASENAYVFEVSTLFFLASWIENAGNARNFPLHLACIGEPPPSVLWLAQKCNALISINEPVRLSDPKYLLHGNMYNVFRGLEVQSHEKRVLLLDVDLLVLSDISGLARWPYCISASPANISRVPEKYWRKVYPELGMKIPTERISCIRGELGMSGFEKPNYPEQNFEFKNMCPYYNGGVIFFPWDCGLKEIWPLHAKRISRLFKFDRESAFSMVFKGSNQIGLATAIEFLINRGIPFIRLPDVYNTRPPHLWYALNWCNVKLYHYYNNKFLKNHRDICKFIHFHTKLILSDWRLEHNKQSKSNLKNFLKTSCFTTINAYQCNRMLRRLYEKYVIEALKQNK